MSIEIRKMRETDAIEIEGYMKEEEQEGDSLIIREEEDKVNWGENVMIFVEKKTLVEHNAGETQYDTH